MTRSAVLVSALALAGCAGEPSRAVKSSGGPGIDAGTADASAELAVATTPELAASAARATAGMRELVRLDPLPPRSPELLRDAGADTCVRAAFAASRTVRVRFEDARGEPRGEATEAAAGMVPPSGPACVVHGEPLFLSVTPKTEGPPPRARAVVVASP